MSEMTTDCVVEQGTVLTKEMTLLYFIYILYYTNYTLLDLI